MQVSAPGQQSWKGRQLAVLVSVSLQRLPSSGSSDTLGSEPELEGMLGLAAGRCSDKYAGYSGTETRWQHVKR